MLTQSEFLTSFPKKDRPLARQLVLKQQAFGQKSAPAWRTSPFSAPFHFLRCFLQTWIVTATVEHRAAFHRKVYYQPLHRIAKQADNTELNGQHVRISLSYSLSPTSNRSVFIWSTHYLVRRFKIARSLTIAAFVIIKRLRKFASVSGILKQTAWAQWTCRRPDKRYWYFFSFRFPDAASVNIPVVWS